MKVITNEQNIGGNSDGGSDIDDSGSEDGDSNERCVHLISATNQAISCKVYIADTAP